MNFVDKMNKELLKQEALNYRQIKNSTFRKIEQRQLDVIKSFDNFYTYITTISGGALVASVTFLGYFAPHISFHKIHIGIVFSNSAFLYTGWFCLLIALASSIYRNYFHIVYSHWDIMRELAKTLKTNEEYKLRLIDNNQAVVLESAGKNSDRAFFMSNISKYDKDLQDNQKKSELSMKTTIFLEKLSAITFILGIFLLIVFAVSYLGY